MLGDKRGVLLVSTLRWTCQKMIQVHSRRMVESLLPRSVGLTQIATENRERAEQDSARLQEELKLYTLQLENAQKDIFRAQDIIAGCKR